MSELASNARALRHHFWGAPVALDWTKLTDSWVADGLINQVHLTSALGRLTARVHGARDVAPIQDAGQYDISLLTDRRQWVRWHEAVEAGNTVPAVLVVAQDLEADVASTLAQSPSKTDETTLLVTAFPKVAFGRIVEAMYPKAILGWSSTDFVPSDVADTATVFPGACIAEAVEIGAGTQIAVGAVIGRGAKIGNDCIVGPNATIGAGVVLGDRCTVGPGARIFATWAGDDCDFRSNAVVGERGYGVTLMPSVRGANPYQSYDMPQIAGVRMGDRCEIRHGSVVDRGALTDTVLGDDVHIDSHATIGHGAQIGCRVSVGALAGAAGQAVVGDDCLLLARSGVLEGRSIAARTTLQMDCIVTKSFLEPGQTLAGTPAMPADGWARRQATLNRLAKRPQNS